MAIVSGSSSALLEAKERLRQAIYHSDKQFEDRIQRFDEWADDYDQDMSVLGFNGYDACCDKMAELNMNKDAKVLDLCCGTGGFGLKLKSLGYTNIYGVDVSPNSIEKCRAKGVYTDLHVTKVGPGVEMPYEHEFFDVVFAIAVLGPNAVDQTCFPAINALIRKGGYFIPFVRKNRLEMETADFNLEAGFRDCVTSGVWDRLPDEHIGFYRQVDNFVPEGEGANPGVVITVKKL